MSEATTAGATGAEATTTTSAGTEAAGAETQDVASLPEWARASLKKANDEAAKFRTQVRDLAPKAAKLDELTEAQKTEQQRAADAQKAAEARAVAAETEAARMRVALTKGLPADLASRLVGTTAEELKADADRLLALFPKSGNAVPSFDGGAATTATATDMNAAIRKAAGR